VSRRRQGGACSRSPFIRPNAHAAASATTGSSSDSAATSSPTASGSGVSVASYSPQWRVHANLNVRETRAFILQYLEKQDEEQEEPGDD